MINEDELRRSVAGAFDHLKSHQQSLLMVYGQIAALKAALDELSGGKFLPLFEKHLGALEARTADKADDLVLQFEDTIRKLRSGGIF